MSFKLVKKLTDVQGNPVFKYNIAIADTEKELETYCQKEFNTKLGKPKVPTLDPYYIIEPSNLIIIK